MGIYAIIRKQVNMVEKSLLDKLKMMGYNSTFENGSMAVMHNSKCIRVINEHIDIAIDRKATFEYKIMTHNEHMVLANDYQFGRDGNKVVVILDNKHVIDPDSSPKEFVRLMTRIPVALSGDKVYKYLTERADSKSYKQGIRLTNTMLLLGDLVINFITGNVQRLAYVAKCVSYIAIVTYGADTILNDKVLLIDCCGNVFGGRMLNLGGERLSGIFNRISKKDNSHEEHFKIDETFETLDDINGRCKTVGEIVW